jgi:hypothetical protein
MLCSKSKVHFTNRSQPNNIVNNECVQNARYDVLGKSLQWKYEIKEKRNIALHVKCLSKVTDLIQNETSRSACVSNAMYEVLGKSHENKQRYSRECSFLSK